MLWTEKILTLLYPPKCAMCDDVLTYGATAHFCGDCFAAFSFISEPFCGRCGRALDGEGGGCPNCAKHPNVFSKNRSLFVYGGDMRDRIHAFKYGSRPELGKGFGALMGELFLREFKDDGIGLIVPVPLHKNRRRVRGYNQASILAKGIAEKSGVLFCPEALARQAHTKPQSALSAQERQANVANTFAARAELVCGKAVLLVDDIMTTGATLNACSEALLSAGAAAVMAMTLCAT